MAQSSIITKKYTSPRAVSELQRAFDTASGHTHDGVDSVAIIGGAPGWGLVGVIADIAVANAAGVQGDAARADHAHKIAAGFIDNAMINAAAAIAYTKLNLTGTIVNADVGAAAAIAMTKVAIDYGELGDMAAAGVDDANAAGVSLELARIDHVHTIGAGVIVNAQIDAAAAIALTKLAAVAEASFLVGPAGGASAPAAVAMSGDATITAAGALTIAAVSVETGMIALLAVTSGLLAVAVSAKIQGTPTVSFAGEGGNARVGTITLKDIATTTLAVPVVARCWLSDTAAVAPSAVAPDGGITIGGGGIALQEVVANKDYFIIAPADDGAFTFTIGETGVKSFFFNIEHMGFVYSTEVAFI